MIVSMRNLHSILLVAGFLFLSLGNVQAQKFGYLNSAAILAAMPATKTADQQLKNLQEELTREGEGKASVLQGKFEAYMAEVNEGKLNRVQMQEREATLTEERKALGKFEQEAFDKIAKKREELYTPILEQVQAAIDAVGEEKGYQFIFDVGVSNFILFAEDSDDIGPLVRAKLGI
jgi:outer membrane protein